VSQASRDLFQVFKEDYVQFPSLNSRISSSRILPDKVAIPPGPHQRLEASNSERLKPFRLHGNTSGHSSEFEKISSVQSPDHMSYCPNAHLTKASSVRTFPCVEKFQTAPASICPDFSAARADDSQCSTSFRISFQSIVMGILL
jgi:hypothetical protein